MLVERLVILVPVLILAVALLGVRRYTAFNIGRHAGGFALVMVLVALDGSIAIEGPVLVLLGAIGGTLVGQAYEAERRRAADRYSAAADASA